MPKRNYDSSIMDDLDIKIALVFYGLKKDETKTSWEIMKILYPECENYREKQKKNRAIKDRIMRQEGNLYIVFKNENKNKNRNINSFMMVSHNFKVKKQYQFNSRHKGDAVSARLNGLWNVFELEKNTL